LNRLTRVGDVDRKKPVEREEKLELDEANAEDDVGEE
jgi:hypothetical protein